MNSAQDETPKFSDPSGAPRIMAGFPFYDVAMEHTVVQRVKGGAGGGVQVNTLTTLYGRTVVPGTADQALLLCCQMRMDANMAATLGESLLRSAYLNLEIGNDLYAAMTARITEMARALQVEFHTLLDEARKKDSELSAGYTAPLEGAPSC